MRESRFPPSRSKNTIIRQRSRRRYLGISPALVSRFGPYTSYQVNVDANGNNRVGDAANEPSICVDRNNPNRMSIGWRQFNSVASNFREAGFAYTTNGGTRWIAPGVLENNVFRSDPVLNSDTAGRFFYLSLVQNFFDDLWRSITGGQSWTRVGPADGGDKQWFTIDNTNSSGHGFQYQCWSTDGNNYGGRQFTRSTDGGLTWMNPINIPNSPAWGTLDVDSAGNLFIGGVNLTTGRIWCVRSINAKNGGVVPTFDRSTAVNLGGDIVFAEPINPEGLVGQVFLAVDRSGTSTNDNVYMLASVQPSGFTNGSDVMFVRSTNGGITFSAPRRINDDPVNHAKWHWFGTLSVAPSGRIDVVWYDTRNSPNNVTSQLFYSFSIDGGNTWSPNVAVSNPFNPFIGYPNQSKIGDYITVVSDDASANVAYAATFNGEEDIYYVRIRPALPPTDFNGDARPDLLLFNAGTRQTAVWYMNNNVRIGSANGPTLPAGWSLASVADFNRDDHPDYLLFNTSDRRDMDLVHEQQRSHRQRFWSDSSCRLDGGGSGRFQQRWVSRLCAVQREHGWNNCLVSCATTCASAQHPAQLFQPGGVWLESPISMAIRTPIICCSMRPARNSDLVYVWSDPRRQQKWTNNSGGL